MDFFFQDAELHHFKMNNLQTRRKNIKQSYFSLCIDKEFSLYPLLLLNFTANDSYVIEIILSLYLF